MTALRATIIDGIPVVVDDDAPPALQIVAACVTEAAVSLVLLALQALAATDPELFAVPLVGSDRPDPDRPSTPEHGSGEQDAGHVPPATDTRQNLSDEGPWVEGDTMALGALNGRAKLSEQQVGQIRQLAALGGLADRRAIAAHFDVAPSTVSDIVNGRLWPHIEAPPPTALRSVPVDLVMDLIRTFGGAFGGPRGVVCLPPGVTPDDGDDDGPQAA